MNDKALGRPPLMRGGIYRPIRLGKDYWTAVRKIAEHHNLKHGGKGNRSAAIRLLIECEAKRLGFPIKEV